ncbi:glycoside hydrolase family 47 protein [Mycena rebaudengoi]|nr:glycoside hydrolase family 47 protein [Mycena rebaudengoi]
MRLASNFVVLALSSYSLAAVQLPGLTLPASCCCPPGCSTKAFRDELHGIQPGQFAFGHDNLLPVTKSFSDGRNGWGASIVDAMILNVVILSLPCLAIDFSRSKTSDTVSSVFETTIRYLGGLLSAYELSGETIPGLVTKAQQLADKMSFAWQGTNAIPFGFLNFSTNTPTRSTSNIAEAGTLALEWSTLTKHSNNAKYANLTVGALKHIAQLPSPLPGLAAQGIDPSTGNFVGAYVTWGGGSDSYFEYLIKYARLSGTADSTFVDAWKVTIPPVSSTAALTWDRSDSCRFVYQDTAERNHLYLADFDDNRRIRHVGSHLACFYAGNWLLVSGGKLLGNQTIVDTALELNDGCWNTYASTATGIGPEAFAYISSDGNFTGGNGISASQLAFFNQHGYYITSSPYILRPEVLESNFMAWRVTGDTRYLDRAASAIDSFNKFLPATVAFASLNNVNSVNGGLNRRYGELLVCGGLESTCILTFDDPAHISLDEWVFNTEAQPFKAPPAVDFNSGSGKLLAPQPFKMQSGPLPEVSPKALRR